MLKNTQEDEVLIISKLIADIEVADSIEKKTNIVQEFINELKHQYSNRLGG